MKATTSSSTLWLPVLLGLLISVINSSAASINDLTYDARGETVTITRCARSARGALEIPSTIEGKSVTSIKKKAFSFCSKLTSITIPDSVTSIGLGAFFGCYRLSNIFFNGDASTNIRSAFGGVSDAAIVTVQPNATGFGATFGGMPVVIAETPSTITKVWIDAEGNFILKLDGSNTGIKLLYSPDLKSEFTEVSDGITQGENELTIKSTAAELQGSHGFFRISN